MGVEVVEEVLRAVDDAVDAAQGAVVFFCLRLCQSQSQAKRRQYASRSSATSSGTEQSSTSLSWLRRTGFMAMLLSGRSVLWCRRPRRRNALRATTVEKPRLRAMAPATSAVSIPAARACM